MHSVGENAAAAGDIAALPRKLGMTNNRLRRNEAASRNMHQA
jgi:hypothetical protein